MNVFLICPVRNATEKQKSDIAEYLSLFEGAAYHVYYPARDTDQSDVTGLRICTNNLAAMKEADEVHIYWDPDSQGSLFDAGMAFALGKKLFIVNNYTFELTPTKSFNNMLDAWETMSKTTPAEVKEKVLTMIGAQIVYKIEIITHSNVYQERILDWKYDVTERSITITGTDGIMRVVGGVDEYSIGPAYE